MRLFVYGTGKVGAYTAFILARASHVHVTTYCRTTYSDVRATGLKICHNGSRHVFHPHAVTDIIDRDAQRPFDFVICTNKVVTEDGSCWAKRIAPLLSEHTALVLLQNGFPEETATKSFPDVPIISAIFQNNVCVNPAGFIEQAAALHRIPYTIGSVANSNRSLRALKKFAGLAPAEFHVSKDIIRERWNKFLVNITLGLSSALFSLESRQLITSKAALTTMQLLADETRRTALAYGVEIPPNYLDNLIDTVSRLPSFAPSLLQDIRERGSALELRMFTGHLQRAARAMQIPTPTIDAIQSYIGTI